MANYAVSALTLNDTYVNTLPYNLCETTGETVEKTVSAGDFSLEPGATVVVRFKYTNMVEKPTLNVSKTGAMPIYYDNTAITTNYLKANRTYTFVFNGQEWDLVGEIEGKISGTVTKAIGGIAKNTVYDKADILDVLEDLLFPYVAFSFTGISTTQGAGTKEYGTTVKVSKVTPTFTAGSKPITSVKIETSGGSELYSGTSVTSGTAISLETDKYVTYNGTTGGTIYCTLSDGTTTTTKSATVGYVYYTYYAVTDTTEEPESWLLAKNANGANVGSGVEGISIYANAGQYIWIASSGNYSGICERNELSGKYNLAADTVKTTSKTLVNSQQYTCENKYNFYRLVASRAGSGTSVFKLE